MQHLHELLRWGRAVGRWLARGPRDRVDVFIPHRDDLSYPVSAWADALLAELEAGRIGAFGELAWLESGENG